MPSRRRLVMFVLAGVILLPAAGVDAQPAQQRERIVASFLLALGRTPSAAEMETWARQAPVPFEGLVARHVLELRAQPVRRRAVVVRAGEDAFGAADDGSHDRETPGDVNYTDLVRRHLEWLGAHPVEYEQVVRRAYRLVLQREAYSIEIEYWKRQPPTSFALLAACIDGWARRNRPGLTATTGVAAVSVNSAYLAAIRLSPLVAAEVRRAAKLPAIGEPADALAAGRVVVAPGAAHLVSVGGIHFVAAGAGRENP